MSSYAPTKRARACVVSSATVLFFSRAPRTGRAGGQSLSASGDGGLWHGRGASGQITAGVTAAWMVTREGLAKAHLQNTAMERFCRLLLAPSLITHDDLHRPLGPLHVALRRMLDPSIARDGQLLPLARQLCQLWRADPSLPQFEVYIDTLVHLLQLGPALYARAVQPLPRARTVRGRMALTSRAREHAPARAPPFPRVPAPDSVSRRIDGRALETSDGAHDSVAVGADGSGDATDRPATQRDVLARATVCSLLAHLDPAQPRHHTAGMALLRALVRRAAELAPVRCFENSPPLRVKVEASRWTARLSHG